MKKLITTLLSLIILIPLIFAQTPRSFLKIRLTDNTPISVAIDRRYYQEENSVVTVRNFPSGRHYLRVFKWSNRQQNNVLIYEGDINLQPGVFSSMIIDRRTGMARINNRKMTGDFYQGNSYLYDWDRNEHYNNQSNWDDDRNYSNYDNSHNNNQHLNEQYGNNNYYGNNSNNNNPNYGNNNYNNGYSNQNNGYNNQNNGYNNQNNGYNNVNNGYSNPNNLNSSFLGMNIQDLNDLHNRVSERITDTDKLKLIQSVLKNRQISTEQAVQIIGWLNFESTKLDFAKWAYVITSDKINYWKIESEFTFESTKSEFNDFLSNKK